MKSFLFAGVKRKEHYSPNHRNNDALILEKTAIELEKFGAETIICSEDEVVSGNVEADLFFSMGRSMATLEKLAELEKKGSIVINSPQASFNCHRINMLKKLEKASVPVPKSLIIDLDAAKYYRLSDLGTGKVWVKRGDVHAIHREDVAPAYSDEELNFILKEFKYRDIRNAVLQENIEGDVVKFYSVRDTEFFYWYYSDGVKQHHFDSAKLKSYAQMSAQALDLLVYGGDAIIDADGNITIIDINDWPSFAPIRNEASRFIAKAIYSKMVNTEPSFKLDGIKGELLSIGETG